MDDGKGKMENVKTLSIHLPFYIIHLPFK